MRRQAGARSDRVSPVWRVLLGALARLPQAALSRATGRLADVRIPVPLRSTLFGAFARATGIDVAEAERPLREYRTFDEFFVRRLRPGARTWPADPALITSPVDGVLGQIGIVTAGRMVQAKGREYSAADLLDDADRARRFDGGAFVTLYLSPRHDHRIHAPAAGSVVRVTHVPGSLLPVNDPALAYFDRLFPRNERLICHIEGPAGHVAVVAVGATNVGRIEAAIGDVSWLTNRRGAMRSSREYEPPPHVDRGDSIMAFHLGSTVVLLFEAGHVRLLDALEPGREIRLGQPIAEPGPT